MFEESTQNSKVQYEGIFVCKGNWKMICECDGKGIMWWICLSLGSVIIISEAEIGCLIDW